MKRRIRKIVNFFAFNLLFFALYLNFIHKESSSQNLTPVAVNPANTGPVYSGTALVQNPEKYADKKEEQKNQDNQQ